MYFSPFTSKLIWSFVSFLSERFFMCFLFASKGVFKFFCLVFLPSFRLKRFYYSIFLFLSFYVYLFNDIT